MMDKITGIKDAYEDAKKLTASGPANMTISAGLVWELIDELTTLRAELDNIKTSWALLHTENEQLRQRITYTNCNHVEHNLNMVPRITDQDAISRLPYWPACNPACDLELGQGRDKHCQCQPAKDALNKLNADREPAVSVPDGWKLVPINPTDSQIESLTNNVPVSVGIDVDGDARHVRLNRKEALDAYAAMLSASPAPDSEGE